MVAKVKRRSRRQRNEATPEEGRAMLDQRARECLNMTGEEFLAAWDAGAFGADPDYDPVNYVAALIPFAR